MYGMAYLQLYRGLNVSIKLTFRPLRYERVYLPLFEVADTPFHI